MNVEYDASVDALAIFFVDKPHSIRTKEIYPDVYLDFDHGHKVIAIEILNASRFLWAKPSKPKRRMARP